ncbi:MAG TPA: hypothetical protein VK737_06680 [Opitutales bacterium]|jgi:hypothetical protein|nr:hypothetical protein [Opitutales bacterium]
MKIVNDDSALRILESRRNTLGGVAAILVMIAGVNYLVDLISGAGKMSPWKITVSVFGIISAVSACIQFFSCKSDFQFDKYSRTLRWRRGGWFWEKMREVPFAEIKEVLVEKTTVLGEDMPGYLLQLKLKYPDPTVKPKPRFFRKDGQGLHYRINGDAPKDIVFIFESYATEAKNECDELATRIREALGHRATSDRPARPAMISKTSFRS